MIAQKDAFKNYIEVGRKKCEMPFLKTLVLAIFAGAFIALAGIGSFFGSAYANRAVGAMIFPGGLAMVILAGSELFTGNCLLVMPLIKKEVTPLAVLRNLGIVYLGNMIGAVLVAFLATESGAFGASYQSVIESATAKASLGFGEAFFRGVLCNVLVALAVWMSFTAKSAAGKIAAIFFPVMIFVIAGFEHSVANMYFLPAGLFCEAKYSLNYTDLNWVSAIFANLLPVTLGNLVGGALVGAGYAFIYGEKREISEIPAAEELSEDAASDTLCEVEK